MNRDNQFKNLDKRRVMANIYQLGFALNEAVLFLDTHPSDCEAIEYYNEVKERYNEAMEVYSEYFGPLLASNVNSEDYWMWVATPMPWEMED